MVAGDGKNLAAKVYQTVQYAVKQTDGFYGRHLAVVYVPGDYNPGGVFPLHGGEEDVIEKVLLVGEKAAAVEHTAQVPV